MASQVAAKEPTIIPGVDIVIDFPTGTAAYRGKSYTFPALGLVPQSLYVAGGIEKLVQRKLGLWQTSFATFESKPRFSRRVRGVTVSVRGCRKRPKIAITARSDASRGRCCARISGPEREETGQGFGKGAWSILPILPFLPTLGGRR